MPQTQRPSCPSPRAPAPRAHGFTLVEMLVVLTIGAILAAIAIPTFNATIAGARTFDAITSLQAALDLARSEAIRRGTTVTLCRVADPAADPPVCTMAAGAFGANDWMAGWVVFVDNSVGGTVGTIDAAELVVFRQPPLAAAAATRAVMVSGIGAVSYNNLGQRPAAARNVGNFNADYRSAPHSTAGLSPRCLTVAAMGQVAIRRGACA